MISLTLFPCSFIDNPRIVGELASCLEKPVYCDEMVLAEIQSKTGRSPRKIFSRLFIPRERTSRTNKEYHIALGLVRQVLEDLVTSESDYIYYGMFSSLLQLSSAPAYHTLVMAEYSCRLQRAMRQLGIGENVARRLIHQEDSRAARWTEELLGCGPYEFSLYDSVVHYNCQDLMDVVAWIYMHYLEYIERLHCSGESDISVRCAVAKKLAEHGCVGEIRSRNGRVNIGLAATPCSFAALVPEILESVRFIEGVTEIKVHRLQTGEQDIPFVGREPACPLPTNFSRQQALLG
jgi:hypothetical protein